MFFFLLLEKINLEEKEPEQAQTPAKSTSFGRSASLHSLHLQEMMSTSKGSEIAPISRK
jgi:hypothetical protein